MFYERRAARMPPNKRIESDLRKRAPPARSAPHAQRWAFSEKAYEATAILTGQKT